MGSRQNLSVREKSPMTDEKLARGLGRWDFTALVINAIIGAGIFGLPAKTYAQIGSYSLFAFAACALIVGLIVLCYAEVSSRFAATGGPYLYAREAFGPLVGFEVGWLYWIVRVTTFAANCNLFVTYLGFFFPASADAGVRIALISFIVLSLSVVNVLGIRQSAVMTNIFTVGKLLPLLIFVAVGTAFIQPANFNFEALPGYSSFSSAVLLLIYAFVGFEAVVVVAGETKQPERTVPRGTITALTIVAVLYILIQIVSIGTLPGLAASERPIADAASGFLGTFGAAFITLGALISIIGNLNVGLISSTRLLFAMAERRDLPAVLETTHSRFKTPWVSIAFTAIIIMVLTIGSSFLTAVAIATITRLIVYATTCLALIVFRRRDDLPPPAFRAPLGVLAAVLSIGLVVWLLTNVDLAKEGLPILAAGAVGLLAWALFRVFGKVQKDGDPQTS